MTNSFPRKGNLYRIAANSSWLVGSRLLRMVVGVVVLGFVGRYLGPSQYGDLSYAISLMSIFGPVATLTFEGIVIGELIKEPHRQSEILGSAFLLRLAGATVASLLCLAFSRIGVGTAHDLTIISVVALALFPNSADVIDLWFQKRLEVRYTVVARSAVMLVSAGVRIGLVLVKAPLVFFAWAMVLDATLAAAALLWVFQVRGERVLDWRGTRAMMKNLLKQCWPLILSGLLVAFYMRIEQILVMNRLGSYAMGVYYAAVSLSEAWRFIPSTLLGSVYPLLVKKRQEDFAGYQQKLQSVYDLLMLMGVTVSITGVLVGPYLLRLIFGAKYQDAIPIFLILVCTAPFAFSGAVRGQQFLIEKLNIYHTWSALIGIAVNLGLALYLMPRIGAAGAAVASLVGYVVSVFLTSWMFPQLRECALMQSKSLLAPFRLRGLILSLTNRA